MRQFRRKQSTLTWAIRVVAPWGLSLGVLVSITAEAGQEASIGASKAQIISRMLTPPTALILPSHMNSASLPPAYRRQDMIEHASLELGRTEDFAKTPDEDEPRATRKVNAKNFPLIDRSRRGDPFVGLRPTFDTHLRQNGVAAFWAHEVMMSGDEYIAFDGFMRGEGDVPGPEAVETFEPYADAPANDTTASPTLSGSTGSDTADMPVLRSYTAPPRIVDGSTPAVARAVALASSTPATADHTPVAVMANVSAPRMPSGPEKFAPAVPDDISVKNISHPSYAALGDMLVSPREQKCLAEAIYFEARGEPEQGQAAVAQVVLNRVKSGLYPQTICGVVYQNRRHRNACQFSFACNGHALRINEPESWADAQRIAKDVLAGKTYLADVGASTHYHANYVRPRWARALKRMDVIGNHIFYKLRPGQT
jgi:Cell Wall Hydrolase